MEPAAATTDVRKLDVLFVCEHALWPADRGYCVHGYQMAAAMHRLGHAVGIATMQPSPAGSPALMQSLSIDWPADAPTCLPRLQNAWRGPYARLRHRIADYQGRDLPQFAGVIKLVEQHQPTTVIALGQHGPMVLAALDGMNTKRVWYAADEPVYFQLSCALREPLRGWRDRLSKIALYSAMHVAFSRGIDGIIGVSPTDTRLLRWMTGAPGVTIRNGVDLDYFRPEAAAVQSQSIIFWGSMDFEPNIDAVTWFARHVWPKVRSHHPKATWRIVGRDPHPSVRQLHGRDGIEVTGGVADIREAARSAAVVVLPLRCGGGIKNKLLEAAAMGLPIVASPRAVNGLVLDHAPDQTPPVLVCDRPEQWAATIEAMWREPLSGAKLGAAARYWANDRHNWNTAAADLSQWLDMPAKHFRKADDMTRKAA